MKATPRLTQEELEAYCEKCGLAGYLRTGALAGEGVEELVQRMQALIRWGDKPATVSRESLQGPRARSWHRESARTRHLTALPDRSETWG